MAEADFDVVRSYIRGTEMGSFSYDVDKRVPVFSEYDNSTCAMEEEVTVS
jgi:hypothetical protein